jgi:hypothetical protein
MLKIIKATYGDKDVTDILNEKISQQLSICATNDLFGDPKIGVIKTLNVIYEIDNITYNSSIMEGDIFIAKPIISPIKIDNPTRTPNKVLCFTTSYQRQKMLRCCIFDILNQSYMNIHHVINIAYDSGSQPTLNAKIYDDILERYGDRLTISYNKNSDQHTNYMNAINSINNIDDYDIFIKIDDDDIYKSEYVENIVSFFQNNLIDISSSKVKTQLNNHYVRTGLYHNLGANPEGYDFNLTATFAFNRKALSLIYDLKCDGFEDFLWRDTWAKNNLVHGVVNNGDNMIWYIHGKNISTSDFFIK